MSSRDAYVSDRSVDRGGASVAGAASLSHRGEPESLSERAVRLHALLTRDVGGAGKSSSGLDAPLLVDALLSARQLQVRGDMDTAVPLLGAAAAAMRRVLATARTRDELRASFADVPASRIASLSDAAATSSGAAGGSAAGRPSESAGAMSPVSPATHYFAMLDSDSDSDSDDVKLREPWPGAFAERDRPRPLGLSLEGLDAVVSLAGGAAVLAERSTGWLKYNVVLPTTASCKRAMVDWMKEHVSSELVRPATVFVSHAYENSFAHLVETVRTWEAQRRARGERGPFYYYVDLLSVAQHVQGAKVPFAQLQHEFGSSVRAIGRVLLVLDWPDRKPLTRAWCVFEIFTAMAVGACFRVVLPPAHEAVFRKQLATNSDAVFRMACTVNCASADAREKDDLANIRDLICRVSGGFKSVDSFVIAAMQSWLIESGLMMIHEEFARLKAGPGEHVAVSTSTRTLASFM